MTKQKIRLCGLENVQTWDIIGARSIPSYEVTQKYIPVLIHVELGVYIIQITVVLGEGMVTGEKK